ncbi:MAG: GFA family protein [Candidatus Synoicihabitans palmerolidicus]|nr:GFA family protein [Candidatus Synoicihabitans palmerolidicus]
MVAEPVTLFACHCSDCQTVTGSGFVLALRVPYGGVTVVQGGGETL